ncbi:DUF927 domain-containing protein [Anaerosporobacter sp.]|uniref:DUF927 domain-containing protein n=1 Tax=Anaerosporobacter sp. TaxID=1872529 RepID=UPI00286F4E1A|nr:DUF927 domain-containing protein [Anaerosporobacter sp.]
MEEIQTLTQEKILSKELLSEIFSISDELDRELSISRLSARAKQLSIKKEFDKLINIFKKTQLDNINQAYNANYTDFSNEHGINLRCGNWIANENGITGFNAIGLEVLACYHPILITKKFLNVESGVEKIQLSFLGPRGWQDLIVEKETISSASKIVSLSKYGVSVTSETARYLVNYLSEIDFANRDLIPIQQSTTKLGWINDNFVPYYGNIEFDGANDFRNLVDCITDYGDYEKWLGIVKRARAKKRIEVLVYIAASLASVLIKPLGALPFIVNLWGDTGKGKTVALMVAASIWGKPEVGAYITDPDASRTALEVRDGILNNLPLMLDDLSKIQDKEGNKFSEIIYMLTNGKGRDRSNQKLTLNEQHTWKNAILTGLERPLVDENMKGGAINRIIDVEMEDGQIFNTEEGRETANILRSNYGFAGKVFIDEIQKIGFDRIEEFQQWYQQKLLEINAKAGIKNEDKQVISMSILLTADFLAEKLIFKDGIKLDINSCAAMLKDKSEISEHTRAYQKILDEVQVNINKFVPSDDRGNFKGEVWGKKENGYVYIIGIVFRSLSEKHNFSPKAFTQWGERNGLVIGTGKGKSIAGKTHRCYVIKLPDDEEEKMETDEHGFVKIDEFKQEELPFN